jgi:hypothetical protein
MPHLPQELMRRFAHHRNFAALFCTAIKPTAPIKLFTGSASDLVQTKQQLFTCRASQNVCGTLRF